MPGPDEGRVGGVTDERCGSTETTTGDPCRFQTPRERCPFHGPGPTPDNGRPSIYDRETADYICTEIASGRSLKGVCREEGMPDASTVFLWAAEDRDGFTDRYAQACGTRLDVLSEELLEISDDGRNDTYVDEDGYEHTNYDVIQRSKLRVDTRKWILSKLKPEKYGKRQRLEHSGPDGGPIEVDVDDARERLAQEISNMAERRTQLIGQANGDRS